MAHFPMASCYFSRLWDFSIMKKVFFEREQDRRSRSSLASDLDSDTVNLS